MRQEPPRFDSLFPKVPAAVALSVAPLASQTAPQMALQIAQPPAPAPPIPSTSPVFCPPRTPPSPIAHHHTTQSTPAFTLRLTVYVGLSYLYTMFPALHSACRKLLTGLTATAALTLPTTAQTAPEAGIAASTPLPSGAHYIERQFRMPVTGTLTGLDVLEVYLNNAGTHPLALLTHGTSDKPEERMQVYSWAMLPQALWFARHGFVALVVVRRGYGLSDGKQDSTNGGCDRGSFYDTGEASADDLRAAVSYAAAHLPEADTATVVSAGVSTGGFAQVALAAKPPAGLKAAINFAGGRGGDGKGHLCDAGGLLGAFSDFGKQARVPMLWIYAENDHWFPPHDAHDFRTAFEKKGGVDQFVLAPEDGEDGHHLFSHVAAWSPTVGSFLHDHSLLPVEPAYPEPAVAPLPPPSGLEGHALNAFHAYLQGGPHKAFASDGEGHYGMALGQITQDLAEQRALERCEKPANAPARHCQVVARSLVQPAK